MYKSILAFTSLLFINPSLSAMDLNETIIIINEASEATQILQSEFDTLVNEVIVVETKEKLLEKNASNIPLITPILIIEENQSMEINTTSPLVNETIFDVNNSFEINASITTEESNVSKLPICKEENNQTDIIDDLNITPDTNNSIPDNGCTDTEVQGTSIRGLIIYKTRIKPFCEMSGETFAKQYMQEDWDDIYYDKEFKLEVLKACPKIEKRYKKKWTPHLHQFTIEYASDSDAIPEC